MGRAKRTPEQIARVAAAQVDFEAVKPFVALFKKAMLDSSKEAEADAEFARLTDSQKDTARMLVFRMNTNGKFRNIFEEKTS